MPHLATHQSLARNHGATQAISVNEFLDELLTDTQNRKKYIAARINVEPKPGDPVDGQGHIKAIGKTRKCHGLEHTHCVIRTLIYQLIKQPFELVRTCCRQSKQENQEKTGDFVFVLKKRQRKKTTCAKMMLSTAG